MNRIRKAILTNSSSIQITFHLSQSLSLSLYKFWFPLVAFSIESIPESTNHLSGKKKNRCRMGACTSIHHKASTMKLQVSSDSAIKPDHTSIIHPSPTTGAGKLISVMDEQHGDVAGKPQLFPSPAPASFAEYGGREEAFFDSQTWLDSDYEDEFMSVNGEFTPSRGNTPVHHSLTQKPPRVNMGAIVSNHDESLGSSAQPSPTPTEKRRRLLDLFKESLRDNNHHHDSNFEIDEPSNKYGQMGSDKDGPKPNIDSHVGFKLGCFKSLLSVRSTGKQKSPSPIPSPNPTLV